MKRTEDAFTQSARPATSDAHACSAQLTEDEHLLTALYPPTARVAELSEPELVLCLMIHVLHMLWACFRSDQGTLPSAIVLMWPLAVHAEEAFAWSTEPDTSQMRHAAAPAALSNWVSPADLSIARNAYLRTGHLHRNLLDDGLVVAMLDNGIDQCPADVFNEVEHSADDVLVDVHSMQCARVLRLVLLAQCQ